jgi:hypothetical protein
LLRILLASRSPTPWYRRNLDGLGEACLELALESGHVNREIQFRRSAVRSTAIAQSGRKLECSDRWNREIADEPDRNRQVEETV